LRGYLANAARVKCPASGSGVFDSAMNADQKKDIIANDRKEQDNENGDTNMGKE